MQTDVRRTATIHAALAAKVLLPASNTSTQTTIDAVPLVENARDYRSSSSCGATRPGLRAQDMATNCHSHIYWKRQQITCPQEETSVTWI